MAAHRPLSPRLIPNTTILSGSGIHLIPLVHLLTSVGKTGTLHLSHGVWVGELAFRQGQLVAAALDSERGPTALASIVLVLSDGQFTFNEGKSDLEADGVSEHELALLPGPRSPRPSPLALLVPGPTAIPHVVASSGDLHERLVLLSRSSIDLLVTIDGERSVRELAAGRGLGRTMLALGYLLESGVISLRPGTMPTAPAAEHACRPKNRLGEHWLAIRSASRTVPRLSVPNRPRFGEADVQRRVVAVARSIAAVSVLVLALVLALVLSLVVQGFRVDGSSMVPSLANGQILLVNRAAYLRVGDVRQGNQLPAPEQGQPRYLFDPPQRGDLVVFHSPIEADVDLIKRVIGLPGDSVLIDGGHVIVNEETLEEPYVRFTSEYTYPANGEPLVIPDGMYFVLGDNRPDSFDSHLGWLVPIESLIGRASLSYWPPSTWGVLTQQSSLSTPTRHAPTGT